MDSFKGSLTSLEAGNAVKDGILSASSEHEVTVLPLADGGEGTLEALVEGVNGIYRSIDVTGPDGKKVTARYGIVHGDTAIIEMAQASGLTLVKENDILTATTYGTGELIRAALDEGIRKFIIGIGGSATNDGGTGMLEALGVRFIDGDQGADDVPGSPKTVGALALKTLTSIDISNLDSRIKESSFKVACDVRNPLLGANGCSFIYGPQKGASEEQIKDMDIWMRSYAELTKKVLPEADPDFPGSGAAGGMGFALKYYLDAELVSGSKLVLEVTHLEDYIQNSDILITGEGRIDSQSLNGKGPVEAARLAKKYGKETIAIAGSEGSDAMLLLEVFDSYHILPEVENFMQKEVAYDNLIETARECFLSRRSEHGF